MVCEKIGMQVTYDTMKGLFTDIQRSGKRECAEMSFHCALLPTRWLVAGVCHSGKATVLRPKHGSAECYPITKRIYRQSGIDALDPAAVTVGESHRHGSPTFNGPKPRFGQFGLLRYPFANVGPWDTKAG